MGHVASANSSFISGQTRGTYVLLLLLFWEHSISQCLSCCHSVYSPATTPLVAMATARLVIVPRSFRQSTAGHNAATNALLATAHIVPLADRVAVPLHGCGGQTRTFVLLLDDSSFVNDASCNVVDTIAVLSLIA